MSGKKGEQKEKGAATLDKFKQMVGGSPWRRQSQESARARERERESTSEGEKVFIKIKHLVCGLSWQAVRQVQQQLRHTLSSALRVGCLVFSHLAHLADFYDSLKAAHALDKYPAA